MRGAEGVVDVEVGERREAAREIGVVGRLAGVEPEVLEQHHPARLELRYGRFDLSTDAVVEQSDGSIEGLLHRPSHGLHAEFGVGLSLGPAAMGHHDQRGAPIEQELEGRQRCDQPRLVGHDSVSDGKIEIGPHQNRPTVDLEIIDGELSRQRCGGARNPSGFHHGLLS